MISVAAPVLADALKLKTGHVDNNVYGIFPLELYLQTRNSGYLRIGKSLADEQYSQTTSDGLTSQARFWVDDLWMVCSLQTQAYRATGEPEYLDRAVHLVLAYAPKLQHANGLFYHSENSHFFWGRGNGWAAAALAQTLLTIPTDHPKREAVRTIYRKMMEAAVRYQDRGGMWRQLVDDADSFEETSCTGMLVFGLATGVENGWLTSDTHRKAAIRGWNALSQYVDEYGNVRNVCIETDQGYDADYYRTRPKATGDFHGQAGVLWAATAMMRMI
jgi:rhamnogalacturonyl hydrolase YesR